MCFVLVLDLYILWTNKAGKIVDKYMWKILWTKLYGKNCGQNNVENCGKNCGSFGFLNIFNYIVGITNKRVKTCMKFLPAQVSLLNLNNSNFPQTFPKL